MTPAEVETIEGAPVLFMHPSANWLSAYGQLVWLASGVGIGVSRKKVPRPVAGAVEGAPWAGAALPAGTEEAAAGAASDVPALAVAAFGAPTRPPATIAERINSSATLQSATARRPRRGPWAALGFVTIPLLRRSRGDGRRAIRRRVRPRGPRPRVRPRPMRTPTRTRRSCCWRRARGRTSPLP